MASPQASNPILFPSLQDMCKLYLVSAIEQYPFDVLAKLPLHMRKKLFMALPVIDRLHFEGTAFLDGLEVKDVVGPDHTTDTCSNPGGEPLSVSSSNEVHICPWLTSSHDFKQGIASIFLPPREPFLMNVEKLCALDFPVGCFNTFRIISDPSRFEDSTRFYRMKLSQFNFFQMAETKGGVVNLDSGILSPTGSASGNIIPSRLDKFVPLEHPTHFEAFVDYCNLGSRMPKALEVRCDEALLQSLLWKYFLMKSQSQPNASHSVYLKKLLSSVETLQLSSIVPRHTRKAMFNVTVLRDLIFPVIRICAGQNMESRTLKALEVECTLLTNAMDLCSCVGEFLCGTTSKASDDGPSCKRPCPVPLDFNCNKEPYLIDSLSVMVKGKASRRISNNLEAKSKSLMELLKFILAQQLSSLKRVTVKLLIKEIEKVGDHKLSISTIRQPCTESIYILMPTLVEFIRQPQFESLMSSVITRDLLHTFISTPATHDQSLAISIKADQPHSSTHGPLIDQSQAPPSSLKFKSLDLGPTDCRCSRNVLAWSRVLRLKMLRIPVGSFLSIPEDAVIEIAHVKIDSSDQTHKRNDVDLHHLHQYSLPLLHRITSFLKKNRFLSILELFSCKFSALPLVNHCLEQLIPSPVPAIHDSDLPPTATPALPPQQQQTLDEIHLHLDTPFCSYIKAYVPQGSSSEELNQQIGTYKETLIKLFTLIRSLGEFKVCDRLVITKHETDDTHGHWSNPQVANQYLFDQLQIKQQVLQTIVEQSGDGRVPKIILRGYSQSFLLSNDLNIFKLIADEVLVES